MNWINRCIGRTGSAAAALALCAATWAHPARADAPIVAAYGEQTIRFTHVAQLSQGPAIGIDDPGLRALLRDAGCVITWKPGERYVLITTAVPVVVSFAVGDRRYDVGAVSLQADFAPYEQGDEVYLPFDELLGALGFALRRDGALAVLQPQINALDVKAQADRVTIVARAGTSLHPQIVSRTGTSVTYAFDGVGTTLSGTRDVDSGGVRSVRVAQTGSVRDPRTEVTVTLTAGASASAPQSDDGRDAVLGFSGQGFAAPPVAAAATASAPNAAPAAPAASVPAASPVAGPTLVTGVSVQPGPDGTTVTVAVSGNATFVWHRLRAPDNRFWIDVSGAQLQGPPIDETAADPIGSVRVRQIDPNTVRIALSLTGPKALTISPAQTGISIGIGTQDVADAAREGSGSVGTVVSSGEQTALVTPAPIDETGAALGDEGDSYWKFAPKGSYVPTNPKMIVIDPGHGGGDRGAVRNDTSEADLNLDMAKRLQAILIARGWQVTMTRTDDHDVKATPTSTQEATGMGYRDSDAFDLQARDDIANATGARLLVSIHCNGFINSGPNGTTTYYSKPIDTSLARIMQRTLVGDLGTKDDGIVKSRLYIPLHAHMPSVLIETAFLSNPDDYVRLESPSWRQRVAEDIADGIDRYTQQYPVAGADQ